MTEQQKVTDEHVRATDARMYCDLCSNAVAWDVDDQRFIHLHNNSDECGTDHQKDSDCTVNAKTLQCDVCGVDHSEECQDCGGRGFHQDECKALEPEQVDAVYGSCVTDEELAAEYANLSPEEKAVHDSLFRSGDTCQGCGTESVGLCADCIACLGSVPKLLRTKTDSAAIAVIQRAAFRLITAHADNDEFDDCDHDAYVLLTNPAQYVTEVEQ